MKKTILFLILNTILQIVYCQIETKFYPNRDALSQVDNIKYNDKANRKEILPIFDVQKLIEEDKLNEGLDIPYRF